MVRVPTNPWLVQYSTAHRTVDRRGGGGGGGLNELKMQQQQYQRTSTIAQTRGRLLMSPISSSALCAALEMPPLPQTTVYTLPVVSRSLVCSAGGFIKQSENAIMMPVSADGYRRVVLCLEDQLGIEGGGVALAANRAQVVALPQVLGEALPAAAKVPAAHGSHPGGHQWEREVVSSQGE